ncbi:MAG TPA: hypothetical protein VGO00_09250 [Kofleriaceae bacterium]|jgi:hypothetical protein|nr:hypothetical protein [Kofleriaceae bacterium]
MIERAWVVTLVMAAACARGDADGRASEHGAAWRDDLATLAKELPAHHPNLFFHTPEATWRAAVAELDGRIVSLDDAHAVVGMMRVVASIGDAHTMFGGWGTAGVYPVAIASFDDGYFVIGAGQAWAIGGKLVSINGHPIDDVIARVTPLLSRDNDVGIRAHAPDVLVDAALLAGLDIAPVTGASFVIADAAGKTRELAVVPGKTYAQAAPPRVLPLHLQGPSFNYWNKYDEPDRLLYFAYNACAEDPKAGPFGKLAEGTLGFIDQHPVDRFVIDLRRNEGGDSTIVQPLLAGLAKRPAIRVFVIIGMHTFSSGVLAAMDAKRQLHATLVGGPTSGKPNAYGEIKMLVLPKSHLEVQYSTKKFSFPDFPADSVTPDIPVAVRSADWFEGRDPAITAILAAH